MSKSEKKLLIITCLISLLPIIYGLYFYNQLPEQIAIHFDVHNQPDNYFSKNLFVFGMPIMMCLFQIFGFIADLKQNTQKEANKKMTQVGRWIIPILSNVMYIVTITYALHTIDIRVVCMIILGIMLLVMGNYLPKTKQSNSFHLGMASKLNDKNYKKIARISGYLMMLNGLFFILSIFFHVYVSVAALIFLFIWTLIITILTFRIKKYEE